jgi:hypothetical protein
MPEARARTGRGRQKEKVGSPVISEIGPSPVLFSPNKRVVIKGVGVCKGEL